MQCPCGSGEIFDKCCKKFLTSEALPATAEQLMRSRYTAFTKVDVEYLKKTLAPESRSDFDAAETKKWAQSAKWKSLKILSTQKGGVEDKKGMVEFIATYEMDGEALDHHETAQFRKSDSGQWLFVEGDSHTHKEGEGHQHHHEKPQTIIRESPKIGRNDPCVCGSGKKYKKCCGIDAA
mgnify:FL=1